MGISGRQILTHHQCYLEHDGMVKLTQIQSGQLLDLLQTVNQRITMDKQLAGSFGHIQIVLKELVDGEQCLLIQRINGVLLENFTQVDLAQGSGELIDQAADTQILIVDDGLFSIKTLPTSMAVCASL